MKLESVPHCPICNSEGPVVYNNVKDIDHDVAYRASFRHCGSCKSLWMDPRPTQDCVHALYPTQYYTHASWESLSPPLAGRLLRLKYRAKLCVLAGAYGYPGTVLEDLSPRGKFAGRILSLIPRFRDRVGYLIRFLHYRPGGRLLDVGCGNGAYLRLMSKLRWKVEGIEPDPAAAKVALAAGHAVTIANAEDVDLSPNTYDAVTLSHVLEHVIDPRALLHKLCSAIRPGGTLISISPNPAGLISHWYGSNWRGLDPPRHLVLPSPSGYRQLLNSGRGIARVTTLQYSGWAAISQSLSAQRYGRYYDYRGRLYPALLDQRIAFSMLFHPEGGNEVVCIFTKQE